MCRLHPARENVVEAGRFPFPCQRAAETQSKRFRKPPGSTEDQKEEGAADRPSPEGHTVAWGKLAERVLRELRIQGEKPGSGRQAPDRRLQSLRVSPRSDDNYTVHGGRLPRERAQRTSHSGGVGGGASRKRLCGHLYKTSRSRNSRVRSRGAVARSRGWGDRGSGARLLSGSRVSFGVTSCFGTR